jgi:hypothetical protein
MNRVNTFSPPEHPEKDEKPSLALPVKQLNLSSTSTGELGIYLHTCFIGGSTAFLRLP